MKAGRARCGTGLAPLMRLSNDQSISDWISVRARTPIEMRLVIELSQFDDEVPLNIVKAVLMNSCVRRVNLGDASPM